MSELTKAEKLKTQLLSAFLSRTKTGFGVLKRLIPAKESLLLMAESKFETKKMTDKEMIIREFYEQVKALKEGKNDEDQSQAEQMISKAVLILKEQLKGYDIDILKEWKKLKPKDQDRIQKDFDVLDELAQRYYGTYKPKPKPDPLLEQNLTPEQQASLSGMARIAEQLQTAAQAGDPEAKAKMKAGFELAERKLKIWRKKHGGRDPKTQEEIQDLMKSMREP